MKRLLALGLAVAGPVLVLGPASGAGTTIGQTGSSIGCPGGSLVVQTATGALPSYETTGGVITSWSVQAGSDTGTLRVKVVRPQSATTFLVTGVSEPRALVASTLNTFPTRIPVVAGDRLALYVLPGQMGPCIFGTAAAGDVVRENLNAPLDSGVGTVYQALGSATQVRIDLSATLEPDADGDGYGDLTQDGCPARPDLTRECTPPDTSATGPRVVRTSKRRAKVTVLFVSEPGATFTCAMDKAAAKPCTSPWKPRLRVGRHRLTITAADAAGNADPTPAVLTLKVKEKGR